jgi:uncharacterized protein
MLKYLLLLVAIVWLFYSPALRGLRGTPGPKTKPSPKQPAALPMVRCVHCGVHLPEAEAVLATDGQPYCSDAHRLAGPASH